MGLIKRMMASAMALGSPHMRELGIRFVSVEHGAVVAVVPYRSDLVGDPLAGILHGGVVTSLLDSAAGAAVMSTLTLPAPIATLDLRIDYLRPSTPEAPLHAAVECYKVTRSVAFTRGTAYNNDQRDPVASMAATFMLNTQATGGIAPAPRGDAMGGSAPAPGGGAMSGPTSGGSAAVDDPASSNLREVLVHLRATRTFERLLAAIPYVRTLGIRASVRDGDVIAQLSGSPRLIGNPVLPALHGGTVGALLESTAILKLLLESDTPAVPKTITLTVEYLRSPRVVDTWARASITRLGRRVANVQIRAFQEQEDRPVAVAHAHFLLRSLAD